LKPQPTDTGASSLGVPGAASLWRMRQTLAFVWKSGPGWAIASGVVIVVGALLPLAFLYAIKLLVDLIAGSVAGGAPPAGAVDEGLATQLLLLVGLAAGIALLQSLATAAGRWIGRPRPSPIGSASGTTSLSRSTSATGGPRFGKLVARARRLPGAHASA
jgi:hypothetical protein